MDTYTHRNLYEMQLYPPSNGIIKYRPSGTAAMETLMWVMAGVDAVSLSGFVRPVRDTLPTGYSCSMSPDTGHLYRPATISHLQSPHPLLSRLMNALKRQGLHQSNGETHAGF